MVPIWVAPCAELGKRRVILASTFTSEKPLCTHPFHTLTDKRTSESVKSPPDALLRTHRLTGWHPLRRICRLKGRAIKDPRITTAGPRGGHAHVRIRAEKGNRVQARSPASTNLTVIGTHKEPNWEWGSDSLGRRSSRFVLVEFPDAPDLRFIDTNQLSQGL